MWAIYVYFPILYYFFYVERMVKNMARPAKSISMKTGLMTKEEINARLEGEQRLRGQSDALKPPSYLSNTQKKIFKFIHKQLESSGILGNLDVYVLAQTAITIDRIQECEAHINENGLLGIDGKPISSVKIRESYMKDFFRLCNELSLSPQSRAKLANINFQSKQNDTDPLLSILGGDE